MSISPRIRVTGDVVGHTSKVEVRVGDDEWIELPVTRATVTIVPGALTVADFDLLRVETVTGAIAVGTSTLEACAELLRSQGYEVTK